MSKLLKTAFLLPIFASHLCAMEENETHIEKIEKNFSQAMKNEQELKMLISYIPIPYSIAEIDLQTFKKSEFYTKAQEFVNTVTDSKTENKIKLRDFLRKNIPDRSNPFEITLNILAEDLKNISIGEKPSSMTHFNSQFFKNKEAVHLCQNALLQICLADSEGYLNFCEAVCKLSFDALEDKKLQATIAKPFLDKYLKQTNSKYEHLHSGLQLPPSTALSLFYVLFYGLNEEDQIGKLNVYKTFYKNKFTGLIEFLLKPGTFDLFKEKKDSLHVLMCSQEALSFNFLLQNNSPSYINDVKAQGEIEFGKAYLQYLFQIVNDYDQHLLMGKFNFGIKRKIDELITDVRQLNEEVNVYKIKFNSLKDHIISTLSTESAKEKVKNSQCLEGLFASASLYGLSDTMEGIRIYENAEDKTVLDWRLTQYTNFWKEFN